MTMYDRSIEWPNLEYYSDRPVFNTKAVVQRTGITAPTLRAWERRYALLAPERAENTYRLYSERDIALIRWLKARIEHGMAISQAVALFRYLLEQKKQLLTHDSASATAGIDVHFDLPVETPAVFHIASAPSTTPDAIPSHEPIDGEQCVSPGIAESSNKSHNDKKNNRDEQMLSQVGLAHLNVYPTIYNMQSARTYLIESFQEMDEQKAQILMGTMFTLYPVEQLCAELITPTMHDIGRLWEQGKLTVSVEHFASNFFRGLLTNLLHVSPPPMQGPMVLACCAADEPHEIAMLMLSLLLRRKGVRVVYLGQSVETAGILHTIKKLQPAALCVSLTIPTHVTALENLARQVASLPEPRPTFIFGGAAFQHIPYMITQIPGVYLEGDLRDISFRVRELIARGVAGNV